MKCQKCGHINPTGTKFCQKCGNPIKREYKNNPIKNYKQKVRDPTDYHSYTNKEKLIIAIVIIIVLIGLAVAVVPKDFELPNLMPQHNTTQNDNLTLPETTNAKVSTKIDVGSIILNDEDKMQVNAHVTDMQNQPVSGGTISTSINGLRYSGQVENGNSGIIIPEQEDGTRITLTYEGTNEYEQSEVTTIIEITKENTKIETNTTNDTLTATLKTENDEAINDSIITVTYQQMQTQEKTDANGQIQLDINGATEGSITLSYAGSDRYNPAEETVTIENTKKDTKIETQYDEEDQTLTAKLTDDDENPLPGAIIIIKSSQYEHQMHTNSVGEIETKLENSGHNRITLVYDGNETYKSCTETVNIVVDEANTTNNTLNDTNNTYNNTSDTINHTNSTHNTTYNHTRVNGTLDNSNTTKQNNVKVSTVINPKLGKDSIITANLKSSGGQVISNEEITIRFSNGKEITRITDSYGNIDLYVNQNDTDRIELIYQGNDEYSSSRATLDFRENLS